ncbi:MAG: hypothetical protein H8D23_14480 [Candidatus Brocadiales bacterium]|nr:hypothetical protein [Candidatus Brocadiales bacterium]MBL7051146.1 hypothetical protein [Candidatus Woesearchaeota archaeon]
MSYKNINNVKNEIVELKKRDFSGTMYDQNKTDDLFKNIKETYSQIQESADHIKKKYLSEPKYLNGAGETIKCIISGELMESDLELKLD